MAHTFTNLLIHVVFATRNRQKDLRREVRDGLCEYLHAACVREDAKALAVGCALEHVHMLLTIPPDRALSDLVRRLKGGSSYWLKSSFSAMDGFAWQRGYSAFSVSRSRLGEVYEYVVQQEARHRTMSFRDEVFSLLKRNEIEYDESRLWA